MASEAATGLPTTGVRNPASTPSLDAKSGGRKEGHYPYHRRQVIATHQQRARPSMSMSLTLMTDEHEGDTQQQVSRGGSHR